MESQGHTHSHAKDRPEVDHDVIIAGIKGKLDYIGYVFILKIRVISV